MRSLLRRWTWIVPALALAGLTLTWGRALPLGVVPLVALLLIGAVLAAVHHAEVIAHRVGEPFGSLVLAVAVTVIEVALIITLMISGKEGAETLARDTAFAAVMITCNGIVGLSLLLGGARHRLVRFNPEGAGAALAVVATLTTLTLVLPRFTVSAPGAQFSGAQLAFVAVAALLLYGVFVQTQTNRHRDFFLPVDDAGKNIDREDHAEPPSTRTTVVSVLLLLVALVAVVGLAKGVSPSIEAGVAAAGIPNSFVGVVIALLVLLPEGLAASRAALRNRIQTSLNLGLGSAMASIGLTIPSIAIASIWLPGPLDLGLGPVQIVLFALTMVVATLTVVPGRATRLQGIVHLILLAAFVFLAISP
ncbi:MAG: ionic transporter y4hA [Micrococcales bacterium]|nr:ionic transporter y4hA [Micrococcales bacterium]